MQPEQLPPMAGSSENPCHHHPHEVVCIEAKKVYDFCFQEDRIERSFPNIHAPEGKCVKAHCEVDWTNITCREVEKRRPVEGKKGKFLVCLAIEVPVRITLVEDHDCQAICKVFKHKVTFLKQVVLCAPEGTEVQCEVTGSCCCVFDKENQMVTCAFEFCVVIQSKADVKLLVPTYGLCSPAPCNSFAQGCPPRPPEPCHQKCD